MSSFNGKTNVLAQYVGTPHAGGAQNDVQMALRKEQSKNQVLAAALEFQTDEQTLLEVIPILRSYLGKLQYIGVTEESVLKGLFVQLCDAGASETPEQNMGYVSFLGGLAQAHAETPSKSKTPNELERLRLELQMYSAASIALVGKIIAAMSYYNIQSLVNAGASLNSNA